MKTKYELQAKKYDFDVDHDLIKMVEECVAATQVTAYEGHLARACKLFVSRAKKEKEEAKEKFAKHSCLYDCREKDVLTQFIIAKNKSMAT